MRLLLLILLIPVAAHSQQVAKTWVTPAGWTMGLLEYRPPGIDTMTRKPALIIYSHGNGEAADYTGTTEALAAANGLDNNEIPVLLTGGTRFRFQEGGDGAERSFVVLSFARNTLQSPFFESASNQYVDWALKYMRDSLANLVDTFRIYLVGISGGGAVGWNFPGRSVADAEKIAAVVQVCPTNEFSTWCNIADGNVPIWVFHAQNDPTTSASGTQGIVNAINACGISTAPIFTNPATGGHSIWPTYLDTNYVGTNSMNVYEWMLQYTRNPAELPTFPAVHKIQLDYKSMWFDPVGTVGKTTSLLIDGDTATTGYPNFTDGYVVTTYHNEGLWIRLDSFINTPKVRVFNNNNSSIQVGFQFYYGRSDTTRHSPWYYTTLPNGIWTYVDSINSRTWSDSVRWVKIDVPDIPTEFREIEIYGNTLGVAPSVYPSSLPLPEDAGRFFQGYGKVQVDTLTDDAGYIQRHQGDAGRVDTAYRDSQVPGGTWVDGKTLVFTENGNSEELTYKPAKRNGRKQWSYFANIRKAFEDPVGNIQRKDILPFSDSTSLASWVYVERFHFIVAAWFGFNTSVNTTGYAVSNISGSERGRGYFHITEVGNEDGQWWNGANKFHSPRVQYLKLKAGYTGAKAADPNIIVMAGAATGLLPERFRAYWFVHYWYYQGDASTFPADAFAFNEYATTAGGQHGSSPPYDGISPEAFNLRPKLDSNTHIRDQLFPGKRLYGTEFGYDGPVYGVSGSSLDTTDNNSNYNVPDIPGQTREQTKSYWVMRWYEHFAGAGWDGAIQYSQRSIGGGDFGTSGFSYDIALPGNPSTYLPAYMQQFLGSRWTTGGCCSTLPSDLYWYMTCRAYRFYNYNARATTLANGDSTSVWVQRYEHTSDVDSLIYSVWKGTHSNSTTSNYVINIPNVQTATLVTPTIGDKDGNTTVLNITGSNVTVPTVNEGVQYILVTVDAGANQSPTAAAGTDQTITLPTSQVTVNGSSSSDPDGTISTYLWTKISGPSTFTITNANNASTTITGLVAGTYVFRLTVIDNDSATDTDDITITVNAAVSNRRGWFRGSLRLNKFRN